MGFQYKPTRLGRQRQLERVGCIACRLDGFSGEDFELVRLQRKGTPADWSESIPLCLRHRGGGPLSESGGDECRGPSLRDEPDAFRRRYGSASELLAKTDAARFQEG